MEKERNVWQRGMRGKSGGAWTEMKQAEKTGHNERITGTVAMGLRTPIINMGDDLVSIVVDTVLKASETKCFAIRDRDIVAVTESVLARAQGNYAGIDAIAQDIKEKFGKDTIGVIFPILSRNRFATCLRGIAKGARKIILVLSYPSDEVGNHLIDPDLLDEKGINPYTDTLSLKQFRELFGHNKHAFTGVDYIEYYKSLVEECGAECEMLFSNNPRAILAHTKNVLVCDIHTRSRTKKILRANGAEIVYGLDDILNSPVNGSGYNEKYGLLGSNKATEETVKLFPRGCMQFVEKVQAELKRKTGKTLEVMVFGDGAFKDPAGRIWELADPVVSPGYTSGLEGRPSEIKLKYLADNDFASLNGEEQKKAIADYIRKKETNLVGSMASMGTTPRKLTDLIGTLCDLVSGSGDKGTPVVYIQGYFDNYAT
jgi:hypothetical protein